jgi:hypothetical protein
MRHHKKLTALLVRADLIGTDGTPMPSIEDNLWRLQ